MNLGHRREDAPDITLTPLIDVVFLLLIFFMVSTTFSHYSELQIELPEAGAEERQEKEDVIEIAIDARGRYFVNGRQLINTQLKTLKQAMSEFAAGREAPPIVISADAKTPHQSVVTAMDAARQLGFVHLSFATNETDE